MSAVSCPRIVSDNIIIFYSGDRSALYNLGYYNRYCSAAPFVALFRSLWNVFGALILFWLKFLFVENGISLSRVIYAMD